MIIRRFPCGPYATNAYLVVCPVTQRTAIIDPSPGSAEVVIAHIRDHALIPDKILLTHSHWDHIADVAPLKELYKIPVGVHPEDAYNLEHPGIDQIPYSIEIQGVKPDLLFKEGDEILVGRVVFTVIYTPGHTPGCVCFYSANERVLISGDTLFKGTIGSLSLPTSRPELMLGSLKKLAALPRDTVVFPGHGVRTTIEAETWLAHPESML